MTHFTALITFGVFTALLPLSGFPYSWEQAGIVVLGVLIALIAWHGKRTYQKQHAPRRAETFEENQTTSYSQNNESRKHDGTQDPTVS